MQAQLPNSLRHANFEKFNGTFDPTTHVKAYFTQDSLLSSDQRIQCNNIILYLLISLTHSTPSTQDLQLGLSIVNPLSLTQHHSNTLLKVKLSH